MTKITASVLAETARNLLASGLCVLPAWPREKRPTVAWKQYQTRLPTGSELEAWFPNGHGGICVLTGGVSGNLEMIDFDFGGELFLPWCKLVEKVDATLIDRLVIEQSPSGGWHVIYHCESNICGNLKLAQRKDGKKLITLIETRGEGGLFLCAPTVGYELTQGELSDPPRLTEGQRDVLLRCAWELNEYLPDVVDGPKPSAAAKHICEPSADRPGDDYNTRGDVRAVLEQFGWVCTKGGDNEYWRRPGKTSGTSATLKDRVFYVFSSNAAPFEPNRGYSPFAVYTLLEHNGDFSLATQALAGQGFGETAPASTGVDISGILTQAKGADKTNPAFPDPGALPEECLRVPGFVSEVMDYCLATAPYPNPLMAFCGALSLQAFLAGRKVRDPGDNRTNIYLLGLAHSAAGKDHPRKVNTRIVHEIGMAGSLGDRFASGEGIQDALFVSPCMLFQTDEIDGMLQSINKAKDARHENVMGTLLTMYSSANSIFAMRRKAGKESPGAIDQPCLVIFGTAIPNHYYEALSERMLTNGFFARMIILESGRRAKGQEPCIRDLPPRVLTTANWWADFRPGTGNLEDWHPVPVIIEHSDQAKRILIEAREASDAEYAKAEENNDSVGTTVWGRVSEQSRKLALIYAASENHKHPIIGEAAAEWAVRFIMHQTRRMLFMAQAHVADNPFHADCLKLMQKLRDAPGTQLPHSVLLKRMKIDARTFQELVSTLQQRGDLEVITVPRAGTHKRSYRLRGESSGVKSEDGET
ncbi:MAG: DUF3987 domain-containing protein [Actinobacteria bacterium]|nr:DUF3987 domain-containing protein [Actinomycetota bacterium]